MVSNPLFGRQGQGKLQNILGCASKVSDKTIQSVDQHQRDGLEQQLKTLSSSLIGFEIAGVHNKASKYDAEFYQLDVLEDKKGLIAVRETSESLEH